jgi:hypothetical protein
MRPGSHRLASVLLLVATLSSSGAALAENAVVVLNPLGGAPVVGQVETTARSQLSQLGWSLVPPARPINAKEYLGCVQRGDTACALRAVTGVDASMVWAFETREEGGTVAVALWIVDGRTGEQVMTDRRECEKCTSGEMAKVMQEFVPSANRDLVGKRQGPSELVLASKPSRANVIVDGVPIGVTPTTYRVQPGPHEIIFERKHYLRETRKVEVEPTRQKNVTAELQPDPADPEPRPSRPIPLGAIACFVGGGLLGIGGGVLWTMHEPEFAEDGGRNLTSRNTRPWSYGLFAGAGVAVVGGVVWWVLDARQGREPSVSIVPTADGFIVGYGGTF